MNARRVLGVVVVLMGSVAWAVNSSTWTVDAAGNWTAIGNWDAGLVPNAVGDIARFGGAITADRVVTLDAVQTVGRIVFDNANRYTIGGTSNLHVDDVGHIASINLLEGSHTITSPIFMTDNLRVTVAGGSTLTTSGNIGLNTVFYAPTNQTLGYGSIIKQGEGVWAVSGGSWTQGRDHAAYANPALFIAEGTLRIDSGNPLGQSGRQAVIAAGATVQLAGGSYGAAHTLLDGGTITGSNNFNADIMGIYVTGGLVATGSSHQLYSGIWKAGPDTLTITGAFTGGNGYGGTSGGLNLYDGDVVLSGAGRLAYNNATSQLRVFGGRLLLDNTGTNHNDRLADAASGKFLLRGGELDIRSNATSALDEVAAPLNLHGGGTISLTASGAAGGSLLSFNGAVVRVNQGTALVRADNLGDAIASGVAQVKFGTAPTLSNAGTAGTPDVGILPYFTADRSATGIGTDLATYDAAVGIRPLTAAEYAAALTAGQNVRLSGSGAVTGTTVAINALVLDSSGGSLNLDNSGQTLTVNSAAILSTGDSANSITGGTITAATHSALGGASREVVFHTARDLAVTAAVTDNGTDPVRLVKAGGGTLTLSEVNTHSGGTYVTDGTLALVGGGNILPDSGAVFVANGVLDLGSHSETIDRLTMYGGTVAGGAGVLTVAAAASDRILLHGGEISATLDGGSSGTRHIRVLNHADSGNSVFSQSILSGDNTYSGITRVDGHTTLIIRHGNALGVADGTAGNRTEVIAGATLALEGGITVGNEALTIHGVGQSYGDNLGPWAVARRGALRNVSGDNVWGGTVSIATEGNNSIGSDAGSLVLTAANSITATGTNRHLLLTGESTGGNEIQGTVTIQNGRLVKDGLGTWRLNSAGSTYTGKTTIYNGTLEVVHLADAGSNSSIGAATGANAVIDLGSAVFRHVGTTDSSTDRVVNLIASGNLDASGAGSVTFTSAVTGTGQNLALLGSGTGTLAGGVDTGANAMLVKSGSGTWTLGGISSYTGDTRVSGGTLLVNGLLDPGSRVIVTDGAALGGHGTIGGPVEVRAGANLSPGNSTGSLELNDTLTVETGAVTAIRLGGSAFELNVTEEYDRLKVSGLTTLGGDLSVSLVNDFVPGVDLLFGILDAAGGLVGTFDNFAEGDTVLTSGMILLKITYQGVVTDSAVALTGGNDVVLYSVFIPEPASFALLLLAAVGIGLRRRY